MSIHRGTYKNGTYYQWGYSGKKYYYMSGNKQSREYALRKAEKQARVIYASD